MPSMNSILSTVSFFFTYIIDRPHLDPKLFRTAHSRNLPVVLSRDEVLRLRNTTTCLKWHPGLTARFIGLGNGSGWRYCVRTLAVLTSL